MLRQLLQISLFLLCLTSLASAQSITLQGRVTEENTKEPVAYAQIRVQGTQTGVLTDIEGKYELSIPGPGVILEISHISFRKRYIKIRKNQKRRLDIELSSEAIRMDEVVISEGLQRVLEDKTIHLYDYEFFEDYLFMIIYDREEKRSKIALVNENDSIVDTNPGPEIPGALVKDCLGNVHAFTANYACQLYVMDGKIAMYKDSLALYKKVVEPCLAKLEQYYYYKLERANGQVLDYFFFNADDGKAAPFMQLADNEKMHQMLDPMGPYAAFASNKNELIAVPESFWDKVNKIDHEYQFDRLAFFYPIHAPLRIVGKQVLVFDHTNGQILKMNKNGAVETEIDISYHNLANWKKQIFIDPARGEAYTWFIQHGFATLREIDLNTGELLGSWELPRQFPKKIQIQNGVVYFMYKELDYDTTNRLYRMRLKD